MKNTLRLLRGKARLDKLFQSEYSALKSKARSLRNGVPLSPLNPTALISEAYVRMVGSVRSTSLSTGHFLNVAGKVMWCSLKDDNRSRGSLKRGNWNRPVQVEEHHATADSFEKELLTKDLLDRLRSFNERGATVVTEKFMNGLTVAQIAEKLAIGESTVERDVRNAIIWLRASHPGPR